MEIPGAFPAPPPTVGREELARWLGVSKAHLYDKLAVLTREHGFPQRLPGSLGMWSRAAVVAWIDGAAGLVERGPAPPRPSQSGPTLEQLYGGAA
ncbi:helix-turn-helix transcriptional regulator [Ancylobacter terrae]|uniref:helix-turn-helix transcriptional regulator n=1 Tax=Ancylobacter sp. sgz301288 TaxID=3342077 RepID=UPI00385BB4B3